MTLKQDQKLNPKIERKCLQCGKIFRRKPYISERSWEQKHKLCSRACIGFSHTKGTHEHGNKYWFTCGVCGVHILGRKQDLKLHKHETHAH